VVVQDQIVSKMDEQVFALAGAASHSTIGQLVKVGRQRGSTGERGVNAAPGQVGIQPFRTQFDLGTLGHATAAC
jgi:hypothetical protein